MRSFLLSILVCALVPCWGASRVGQPVQAPKNGKPAEASYGFLKGQPQVRFTKDGEFEITFETSEPTPPAVVYGGISDITEELDYNRYRSFFAEDKKSQELRTQHTVKVNVRELTRQMYNTKYEPRITWRAEVYLPKKQSSRFFEGRVYFDPKTFGDTVNVPFGPFVEQVTTQSAVIYFETDRPTRGQVAINGKTFPEDGETTQHQVLVSGLEPGKSYEYHVTAGPTKVRPYSFRTDDGESFQFAAMVDCREGVGGGMINNYGVNADSMTHLVTDCYRRGADLILFAGDLINGYTTDQDDFVNMINSFRSIMGPVQAHIPVYEGMGNHEVLADAWDVKGKRVRIDKGEGRGAEELFAALFCNPENGPEPEHPQAPTYKENVYAITQGHSRIIMLNNNYWWSSDPHKYGGNLEGLVLPKQLAWFKQQIAEADADPNIHTIFVAAQEPAFPNGGHTNDAMWWAGGDTNRDGKVDDKDAKIVQNRNELWETMASTPKMVAFITGDEHAYARLYVDDNTSVGIKTKSDGSTAVFKHPVWQVTSGGAGAPWYDKQINLPWSPNLVRHSTQPHYAYFDVQPDSVKLEAYSQTGERLDSDVLWKDGAATGK